VRRAFGWGGSMALVRLACSFVSIKVTAVYLGPAGLALVAQLASFLSLFQSMLGQGLVTGLVRISSEQASDGERRRATCSTALNLGAALTLTLGLVLALASSPIAGWLLGDTRHAPLIAVSGIAVAAAVLVDLLQGALGVSREIHLIGATSIAATLIGLALFAPSAWLWGTEGALWANLALIPLAAAITAAVVHRRSRQVRLRDFIGRFDPALARRILGFYPMLIVNGALPPLALILVRDALTDAHGLDTAGLWQASWRLSEAYLALVFSSVSLYFMPSMGERAGRPAELRQQMLRTLLTTTAATALMALAIFVLRDEVVHLVLSARFAAVSGILPVQLLGDVAKAAGVILGMSLVATMRSGWFIAMTALSCTAVVGGTHLLAPALGAVGVSWAHLATGLLQIAIGTVALRDLLWPGRWARASLSP
jgi:PST family polysaccharide transporter